MIGIMINTWFYMFTRGNNILYIGIAYHQDVYREIKQELRMFDISGIGLFIWLGYIIETSYRRITENIVRDVECLLIYTNQPSCNKQCKMNYTGRDNLKVRTKGCKLLRRCVKVEKGQVYERC